MNFSSFSSQHSSHHLMLSFFLLYPKSRDVSSGWNELLLNFLGTYSYLLIPTSSFFMCRLFFSPHIRHGWFIIIYQNLSHCFQTDDDDFPVHYHSNFLCFARVNYIWSGVLVFSDSQLRSGEHVKVIRTCVYRLGGPNFWVSSRDTPRHCLRKVLAGWH